MGHTWFAGKRLILRDSSSFIDPESQFADILCDGFMFTWCVESFNTPVCYTYIPGTVFHPGWPQRETTRHNMETNTTKTMEVVETSRQHSCKEAIHLRGRVFTPHLYDIKYLTIRTTNRIPGSSRRESARSGEL